MNTCLRYLGARVVCQGSSQSRWFGYCWLDHRTETSLIAPFGLHLLIRWVRMAYWRVASVPWESRVMDKAYMSELIIENRKLKRDMTDFLEGLEL